MGGSKSKSKSTSNTTTTTTTKTNNLSLDGVEGITVAGSKGITINQTSDGAFDVVGAAMEMLESSQSKALQTVSDTALGSFDKINESNQSETALLANKFTVIAVAGLGVWAVIKWKRA